MNLILLDQSDFIAADRVCLKDRRRLDHLLHVLSVDKGQTLMVGKLNGLMGQGIVVNTSKDAIELQVKLDQQPPPALPLTLIFALPRPPMLRRMLFTAAMLGVKKIIILNFNRVEKSLWNSSSLKSEAIGEQLILGLEQAKDTILPEVVLKKAFKPFVEDELPLLVQGKQAFVAHPDKKTVASAFSRKAEASVLMVIGPEGGIIDYEIQLLTSVGCQSVGLGSRILRTESVLPFIIGKLF